MGNGVVLKRIRLTLARDKTHPDGDAREGYDFLAPLKTDGRIDLEMWKQARAACAVRRIRGGYVEKHGALMHRPGGVGGASWVFEYAGETPVTGDEEAGYRFQDHAFTPGEYVSIRDEDDDILKTYKVASVSAA